MKLNLIEKEHLTQKMYNLVGVFLTLKIGKFFKYKLPLIIIKIITVIRK